MNFHFLLSLNVAQIATLAIKQVATSILNSNRSRAINQAYMVVGGAA